MKTETFHLVRMETFPDPRDLLPGVLYYSEKYGITQHLCACGCGEQTPLPVGKPDGWEITFDGDLGTLAPSIGNYQIPCKSHYFIRQNRVVWAG